MLVYVDVLIGLNFLVDYLLLMGTNALTGYPIAPVRTALGAAVGGLYAGACLLPNFSFLRGLHWQTVDLLLMTAAAFGWQKGAWKRCGIFLLLSFALGGFAMLAGSGGIWELILTAVGIVLLCRLSVGSIGTREYVPVEIRDGKVHLQLTALKDTGNTLRDPLTGESVLVVDCDAAKMLAGLSVNQLKDPLTTITQQKIPGIRLIPFHAVGMEHGMLLAKRYPKVKIGKQVSDRLVAFAPDGLGGTYRALTGGII